MFTAYDKGTTTHTHDESMFTAYKGSQHLLKLLMMRIYSQRTRRGFTTITHDESMLTAYEKRVHDTYLLIMRIWLKARKGVTTLKGYENVVHIE